VCWTEGGGSKSRLGKLFLTRRVDSVCRAFVVETEEQTGGF